MEASMSSPAVAARYVTADFKNAPLIALADLMGLKNYTTEITKAPEAYSPILSGIAVYRHLPSAERQNINDAIINGIARSNLTARLMALVGDQSVQPYWYMWSLSDKEVKEFFTSSSTTASVTDQFNPLSFPDLTATTVAAAAYYMAKGGPRALASHTLSSLKKSELVMAVGRHFGLAPAATRTLGSAALPAIIVISGLNIMAKKQASKAKKELAARGLLVYRNL
jgi:hypothetical protein